MARNRTPSKVIELRGGFKNHPERRRKREPVPSAGIGPAPKAFDKAHGALWDEVVSIMPGGVLGNSDRIALEALIRLVGEFRENPREFASSRMTQMISLLARFGLTPSDRTRLSVPPGKGGNEFEDL